MVTTAQICTWMDHVFRMKIPRPVWVSEKHVFEYPTLTGDIVAYLKLVRATQSLHSLPILMDHGLTADFGASARAVIECTEDALFLLERNPASTQNVKLFLEDFASTTIDSAGESTHQRVKREKIRNSASRALSSVYGEVGTWGESEKIMKEARTRIWNAWCSAVHSNYAEIMMTYGPRGPTAEFKLSGLPEANWTPAYRDWCLALNREVAFALWFAAHRFEMLPLADEIRAALDASFAEEERDAPPSDGTD